ncbi:TPA: efflux RND transporter permease subunit [Legionella pneumophila]|nr:efflux RND transporter permease subunit [Legionella pneumophila]HAT7919987.1 CusA/CzcA family heavy metal efflux RND transporter [Legionella pneumophila]HAT7924340.1 CusA/CzcA family heavy metal efflux RND transporter [Legionella pneumophila]HAT7934205.1 CusA/CzcA family heavy metal efflux RND transporter [Legionella pneumophila]HAT8808800.1 CusA/CzcA family heavy metal efflux RND transporter [Legionella pneumophila]
MINNIIEWSIKNRFLMIIVMLLLIASGIYTLLKTPVDAIPDLSDVQVIIKTSYPGQAPRVVEDQVTYPLATAMLAVPGAITVRAYSYFGDSYIYIIFKDGTDLYWARSRVLEYLNQVAGQLPPGAKPELGPDATGVGWVYQYALVDESGTHNLSQLTTLQNWLLKFELQTVPGVSEVATVGGMVKQYQVVLEPNRIRAYGISLAKVKHAIMNANSEIGGSVIEMGEAEYMVRTDGYIQSIQALKNIPLGVNEQGTPILLSNVARITLGPQMRRDVGELNGKGEAVGGVIVMRMGDNALATIQGVKDKLASIQKSLPKGVKIVSVYDRSGLIYRAIDNLSITLLIEFIVVASVCMLFLFHFRSSLVVILSLPIGVLAAFIVMYLQGINANIMSLSGIAIAIGVMVDAAIIMVENMHKQIEAAQENNQEVNRWQMVSHAAKEVGPTLFFSLLITTVSFLPVFALQAQEGRMFSPLAYTKTYAMAAAAILSITLVPVLMGYFIRGRILPEYKNPINRMLLAAYRPVINMIIRFPRLLIIITIGLFLITYWPLSKIGSEFMPPLNEGDLMYMPTMLPGVSIGKARQVLQQTDKMIKQVPEVKRVYGKVGRAQTATDPAPLTMIETIIQLKDKSEWRKGMTIDKIKQELNQMVQLPGVTNAWVMPIKTRIDMLATGIKTPIGIKITGPSLTKIQDIGEQLEGILKQVKGTTSVYADRSVGGRYVTIKIDRQKAARFALNIQDIQEIVKTAIGGMNVTETIEGRERYPVNLRYPQTDRDSVDKLKLLPIVTPSGAHIPLGEVANVAVENGPPVIKSEDAKLTGWILVDISDVDIGSYVANAQKAVAEKLKLPTGYQLIWSGQYEYMQRAKARLALLVPVTLVLIFLLLYVHTHNLIEVLIVMGTLPLSFIGGIWLMYWLNYNMSVAVGVGFIALAGVAVETGMVLLNYLNHALRRQQEKAISQNRDFTMKDLESVVEQGALFRIRPIMMAIAATFAGLIPVILSRGTGSEVMRRITAPMVGGLISATILTLIVIPAIYLVWKTHLTTEKSDK